MKSKEDLVWMMNKAIGVCKPNTHPSDQTMMSITAVLLSRVHGLESLLSACRLHAWAFVSSCVYVIAPLCCSQCQCVNEFNCPRLCQAYIWQHAELYAQDSLFIFSIKWQIYHPKHNIKNSHYKGRNQSSGNTENESHIRLSSSLENVNNISAAGSWEILLHVRQSRSYSL